MLHIVLPTIVQYKNSRNLTFHDQFRECVQIAASRFIDLDELKANLYLHFYRLHWTSTCETRIWFGTMNLPAQFPQEQQAWTIFLLFYVSFNLMADLHKNNIK